MTPKERSDELNRLVRGLNEALEQAADEGLDVWVRTNQNQRIDAAPVSVVAVSVTRKPESER